MDLSDISVDLLDSELLPRLSLSSSLALALSSSHFLKYILYNNDNINLKSKIMLVKEKVSRKQRDGREFGEVLAAKALSECLDLGHFALFSELLEFFGKRTLRRSTMLNIYQKEAGFVKIISAAIKAQRIDLAERAAEVAGRPLLPHPFYLASALKSEGKIPYFKELLKYFNWEKKMEDREFYSNLYRAAGEVSDYTIAEFLDSECEKRMNEWNKYRDSESSVSLPIDHLFSAAHRGDIEYLKKAGPRRVSYNLTQIYTEAIGSPRAVEVLNFLYDFTDPYHFTYTGPYIASFQSIIFDHIRDACGLGKLDVVEWIVAKKPTVFEDMWGPAFGEILCIALHCSHLDCFDYVLQKFKAVKEFDMEQVNDVVLSGAVSSLNIKTLRHAMKALALHWDNWSAFFSFSRFFSGSFEQKQFWDEMQKISPFDINAIKNQDDTRNLNDTAQVLNPATLEFYTALGFPIDMQSTQTVRALTYQGFKWLEKRFPSQNVAPSLIKLCNDTPFSIFQALFEKYRDFYISGKPDSQDSSLPISPFHNTLMHFVRTFSRASPAHWEFLARYFPIPANALDEILSKINGPSFFEMFNLEYGYFLASKGCKVKVEALKEVGTRFGCPIEFVEFVSSTLNLEDPEVQKEVTRILAKCPKSNLCEARLLAPFIPAPSSTVSFVDDLDATSFVRTYSFDDVFV